jgi:predicted ribosome quality control (RQC) complex YloA/Tae2 family protein
VIIFRGFMDKTEKPRFREWIASTGTLMLAGRSAENNEELISQVGKEEYVLHTAKPGSPFVNIKIPIKKTTKEDLRDAALFCAKHSQNWRDNKQDVKVHVFKGKDIYKKEQMKKGTFGVKVFKEIVAKKGDIKKI